VIAYRHTAVCCHRCSRFADEKFKQWKADPTRYRGTCYGAANGKFLGLTTGRNKNGHTYKPNRPIKQALDLPLTPPFRELLGH
jgi:hypothetical protein